MQHASYSALEALQIHHGLSYAYGLEPMLYSPKAQHASKQNTLSSISMKKDDMVSIHCPDAYIDHSRKSASAGAKQPK